MKSEKLSTEIAALERKVKDAKNETVKKLLNKKLSSLKEELKKEDDGLSKLSKAKKKIREMSEKDFNEFIKNLSKKEGFAFLKSMTKDEIKRDIQRVAKPVGWRFRGDNTKKPTRKDIKEGNNVYWEGRRNRSDVSRAVKLETGGTAASSETGEFIGGENASSMYKNGGAVSQYIVWVSKDGDKREFYGEYKSQRAAKMAMDKLWNTGEYDSVGNKSKSSYEKDGFYKDGGEVEDEAEYDSVYEIHIKEGKDGVPFYAIWDKIDGVELGHFAFKTDAENWIKSKIYADGGEIEEEKKYVWEHRHTKGITAEILDTTSKGFKVKQTEEYEAWGDKKLSKPKVKTAFYSKKEFLDLFKIKGLKYEQGGGLSDMPESFPNNDAMSYAKGGSLFDEPHRSEMKGMMKLGGKIGREKREKWGKHDLYPMYDNVNDLSADLIDYFEDLKSDINENYSNEMKQAIIKALQTNKV